jgi:hypothetical protein
MRRRNENCVQIFCWKSCTEKVIDVILRREDMDSRGVEWILVAQDMDQWRAFVDTVIKRQMPEGE